MAPKTIPCPDPRTASARPDDELVGGGCLVCGLGQIPAPPDATVQSWDPWRPEHTAPTGWTAQTVDPTGLIGRGLRGRQIAGHTCPACTAAVADTGLGPSLVDAVIGAEFGLGPGESLDGSVPSFAAVVLDARRRHAPDPTGGSLKFAWMRDTNGVLLAATFGEQPEPRQPTTEEQVAAAVAVRVAEVEQRLRAELAPPVQAAKPEPAPRRSRWKASRTKDGTMTTEGIVPGAAAPDTRTRIDYAAHEPFASQTDATRRKRRELIDAMQAEETARRRR